MAEHLQLWLDEAALLLLLEPLTLVAEKQRPVIEEWDRDQRNNENILSFISIERNRE